MLGRVTLVTGPEEFLDERTVVRPCAAVGAHDAEAELSETTADQLTLATLGELAAPSLFSTTRCVVVRRLEDLPEESVDGLLGYAAAPADDVALVLVHSGGQKGSGVLDQAAQVPRVTEVKARRSSPRVPRLRRHRGPRPRRPHRQRRGRRSWCRPSGRTCARSPRPPASWPATSAAEPMTPRWSSSTSADGPRRSRSRSPTPRFCGSHAPRRSRSCAGRSTAAPRRCWSPARSPAALRGLAKFKSAPARHARRRPGARGRACRRGSSATSASRPAAGSRRGIADAIRVVARADADVKGAGQRPVVRPGADGAHRHRAAQRALTRSDAGHAKTPHPRGYGARRGRSGQLRATRPACRSPTCGWRPGSCG